jgi:multidrug efflux pump subunit AcrA (membrane-fusion protein)
MRGIWLRILGLLVLVVGIAVAGGWWMMRGQLGDTAAAKEARVAEETAAKEEVPLPRPDTSVLTLPGVIEPYESIPVSSKLNATITAMMVRDGSNVAKGQLLCVLEDTDLRQQIESARVAFLNAQEALRQSQQAQGADLERKQLALRAAEKDAESWALESKLQVQDAEAALSRAQRELTDYQALYQAKAVSADDLRTKQERVEDAQRLLEQKRVSAEAGTRSRQRALEQAQLDMRLESVSAKQLEANRLAVENARGELHKWQRRLGDLRVVAPVGGTVRVIPRTRSSSMTASGMSVEVLGPGVRVWEGDPFLEVATTERACVRIEVDETDIGRLRVGVPAKITGDAFGGEELQGKVAEIQSAGRRAGQGVSLFPVTVLITSPLRDVHMGMTADVTIKLEGRESKGDSEAGAARGGEAR